MKEPKKQSSLKQAYYRSFLLFIVIPLVVVFVGAEVVVSYMIRSSTIETIDALQTNIATTLSGDVRSDSLQLSHFVHNNNGEFMETAVQCYRATGSRWYQEEQRLRQAFRTAMVPSQNILAGSFYMRDGGAVHMKDDITLPGGEVRQADWYLRAVERPNATTLGCYDTSRVRLTSAPYFKNELVLVTAMSPDPYTDRSGEIETVVLFTVSRAGDVLRAQQKDDSLGASVILDGEGRLLFGDMGEEAVRDYFQANPGSFPLERQTLRADLGRGERRYFFKTKDIPDTDWRIVTFVEENDLERQFYRVGGLLALIVAALLLLFYFYSRYFLGAIIAPVQAVCRGMDRLENNDLEIQLEPTGQREIRELMESFNQMVRGIRNMLRMSEETLRKRHEAEMRALQSQINPHFVVNTLSSIRFMAQVAQFDGIRKMAEALISIVSCSFRSNVSFYTVGEELEMLRTYVYLMRIRYSNGFEASYEVQPDCMDYLLPRLTLQPVVENAITHGFDELEEELGQILVSVYREEGFLCLSVRDNGKGMTEEQIQRVLGDRPRQRDDNTSIGIENVQARLRLNFGGAAGIGIQSEPGVFTRVTLRLPLDQCRKKEEQEEGHDTDRDCG